MKSAEGVCLQCSEYSHAYLSLDKRVGDTAATVGGVPQSCERLACSKMCLVVQEMCMGRRG